MHHHSFPKHIFVLFLLVERACKSSLKESLTHASSHLRNAVLELVDS